MIGAHQQRPGRLTIQLLRLQYWYDRLSEPRRLLVGLGTILFLAACLLYVLGFTSSILVSRMELGPAPAETPAPIAVEAPATPAPGEPTSVPATPTATPADDGGGNLIRPPEVPDVAIIPVPPRLYEPQPQPIKPRVVATPIATARTSQQTAVTVQATRSTANGAHITPGPTTQRTAVPTNGAARGTATPVRAQQAGPTATRGPVNPPNGPPAAPRSTAPAVQSTPATKPR